MANLDLAIASGVQSWVVPYDLIRSFFFLTPGASTPDMPTSSTEERVAMLKALALRGIDFLVLPYMGSKRHHTPATTCAIQHRQAITECVAAHLPVEGVPEMVARYTATPYDCILGIK